MKIKEIKEGFIDSIPSGFSGLNPDASMQQRVTQKRSDSSIKRIAGVAVKAWAGRVNTLEKKQGGPINDQQYVTQLIYFVHYILMGDVSLTAL